MQRPVPWEKKWSSLGSLGCLREATLFSNIACSFEIPVLKHNILKRVGYVYKYVCIFKSLICIFWKKKCYLCIPFP